MICSPKCLQMVCFFETESKRESMERKHIDSLVKKKFRAQWLVKKIILTVFKDIQGSITVDFLEKNPTVNSASYCQLLWQNSPYFLNELDI